ncbi:MAG: hypothetical protein NTV98_05865 [Candidatus Roizmanbacteria bacterium]|nr:hypothetical protein [Candidatus Roizmanbacteria bacterium]
MNIYLDIDGVLLVDVACKANHSDEFIKYVVTHFPDSTYWLTTHCRQKENYTIPLLSRFFGEETMKYIRQIKPTEWDVFKTEGIDFSTPFLWFDDDLFDGEKKELIKHNVLDNWIQVDFYKDENQFQKFLTSFPIPAQLI